MSHKMDIREAAGVAGEIGLGRGLRTFKHYPSFDREVPLNAVDLGGGLRQTGILGGGGRGVANQQQVSQRGSGRMPRAYEQRQGTGVAEDDVVDPVMWLGRRRDQGLEVQVIERAVGDDDYAHAGGDELLGGRNEHVVKLAAGGIAGLERIARAEQGLAVVLHGGVDLGVDGELRKARPCLV